MATAIQNQDLILLSVATRLQLAKIRHSGTALMRGFFPRLLPFAGLLFVLSGLAFAGVGGSISGTVKDSTGAAIVGASVSLTNSSTGVQSLATADGRGSYTFPVLPVGTYVLEASHTGFKP